MDLLVLKEILNIFGQARAIHQSGKMPGDTNTLH
jgi:hypothetical protein